MHLETPGRSIHFATVQSRLRRHADVGVLIGLLVGAAVFAPAASEPFNDHQNMMEQVGVKKLRRGADPNHQATFDEATANPYTNRLPDVLTMKNGTKVTRPEEWPKRRAEIQEDFEREVYGRIPADVPKVSWTVTSRAPGTNAGISTITTKLEGRVDNSAYTNLDVRIQASFTVPAKTAAPVPVMIEFGGGVGFGGRRPAWPDLAITSGWGYGNIVPGSIQPDNNRLTTGIIGLANRGRPRRPEDWGALRAWQWGASRLLDYFAAHPESEVNPAQVGIAGLSRYGKAAIVTLAFDPRFAVGLIGSSGQGGTKLHRRMFGELVENLTGGGYYWMAGNYLKYGAEEPLQTAADLPVDAHELIALCAPRPCFISYGIVERGDAKWVDAHGSFMAGVLAGPVYRLLGKQDFGTPGNYLTDPMPPVNQLIGGELAWRQHDGGHDLTPNWPAFFQWVSHYLPARPTPAHLGLADQPVPRADRNSQLAHEQLVAKARQGGIDVYFLGDSITRRWGTSDRQYQDFHDNWRTNFFGWNAGNFGWGADSTQHILWRIQNGELDGVNPRIIVLLAGINNVGSGPGGSEKVADITRGLKAIVQVCQEKAPGAVIILTGLFPRNDNLAVVPEINQINANLAQLADGKQIRYLNVNAKLADADGKLFPGMSHDKLHPTLQAYQIWADGLKPLFTEILGPPAPTDHAPPATGDPSAR